MKRTRDDAKENPTVVRPAPAHRGPLRPVAKLNHPKSNATAVEQGGRDDRFACPLCLGAISDVIESSCCATLYCQSCAKESFRSNRQCPHCREDYPAPGNAGDAESGSLPASWTHSRWIQRQIDEVAPKCDVCRKNLFAEDKSGHEPQCEGRHAKCFKCEGKGALDFTRVGDDDNSDEEETATVTCDACGGNQFLVGLEWTKCTKCEGRGEIFFVGRDDALCDACKGRGALKGLEWTKCYRCLGRGGLLSGGDLSRCVGCKGKGQLKGKDWTACIKCNGRGTYDALNGSRVLCNACQGKAALKGLDWTKCFNCRGKGAYNGENGAHFCCHACSGKGALHGVFSKCFKCEGKGTTKSGDGHYRIPCSVCAARGALQGLDWSKCPSCNGCGSGDSVQKDCAHCAGMGVLKGLPTGV